MKPENIIFETNDKNNNELNIKLIDFGLSKLMKGANQSMQTKLGTPYYVSPEVLEGIYDKRCDLWAVGVLTFTLLSGSPPFNGKNEKVIFDKIATCDYDFDDKIWETISEEA